MLCIVSISACKKADDSPGSVLTGTWIEHYIVYDDNGNGVMDANEYTVPAVADELDFNTNGTGNSYENGFLQGAFDWTLVNGGQYLQINFVSSSLMQEYYIQSLGPSTMVLQSSYNGTSWMIYGRQ